MIKWENDITPEEDKRYYELAKKAIEKQGAINRLTREVKKGKAPMLEATEEAMKGMFDDRDSEVSDNVPFEKYMAEW